MDEGRTQDLGFQPWTCLCETDNPANNYKCVTCFTINESIKSAIMSRPIYVYPRVYHPPSEESKGEKSSENGCAFCGRPVGENQQLCVTCSTPVPGESVPLEFLPMPPNSTLLAWKCENCETENYGDSNCINCSMIRRDRVHKVK